MTLTCKIVRKIQRLWCKPIVVFCFHKVSDTYEPLYGGKDDWTQTDQFKRNIMSLRDKYTFISLEDAYSRLRNDTFRFRNYAVLTSDDGYQCILDILQWLNEMHIPVTLFLSTKYLDGKSYDPWFDAHWNLTDEQKCNLLRNMYIQSRHLSLPTLNTENVTLSLHGYGHDEVSWMNAETFRNYVQKSKMALENHPRYRSYYAYTWGHHSKVTNNVLRAKNIVPVYMDGQMNDSWDGAIHRVNMDGVICA